MPAGAAHTNSSALGPKLPYWGGAAVGREEQRWRWRTGMDPAATAAASAGLLEPGAKELAARHLGRTAHNMSSSSLRKKSDLALLRKVPCAPLRRLLDNLQEEWVFVLSLIGLVPLAERLSFLTEQVAFYTGPTVGGLLNATFGNVTEVIIAIFALYEGKVVVVKCSLLGSILSNLLLVLGTSLFLGGLANLGTEQPYDRMQADVSTGLLILGVLCHSLPLMLRYAVSSGEHAVASWDAGLELSRACSVVMLLAYVAYLFFQLKTHRQLFEPQEVEDDGDDSVSQDEAVLGFSSAMIWLGVMTLMTAVLSEFVVSTIEAASKSWELSVSFISIILIPIVGNAAEHAGAVIFAFKNKLDITLGVSLGSATQISMFVVPLSVLVGWIMGVPMDLDFNLLETGSLFLAIFVTTFTLQDGSSHYLKGLLLLFCYVVIAICFFVLRQRGNGGNDGADPGVASNTWRI
ncbi:vacuolar cation/proton exchanger 1b-like [Panicum miliaceum]|uniref:Vacuolar cation/proton exchanger n=1 Tax=Panicum miliaceum TaxID=4540 RepID=A0A3L6T4A5_PANMI|nr:vacuolar cation/proton exchanger 1b-like [Panicum miliaceum]